MISYNCEFEGYLGSGAHDVTFRFISLDVEFECREAMAARDLALDVCPRVIAAPAPPRW